MDFLCLSVCGVNLEERDSEEMSQFFKNYFWPNPVQEGPLPFSIVAQLSRWYCWRWGWSTGAKGIFQLSLLLHQGSSIFRECVDNLWNFLFCLSHDWRVPLALCEQVQDSGWPTMCNKEFSIIPPPHFLVFCQILLYVKNLSEARTQLHYTHKCSVFSNTFHQQAPNFLGVKVLCKLREEYPFSFLLFRNLPRIGLHFRKYLKASLFSVFGVTVQPSQSTSVDA